MGPKKNPDHDEKQHIQVFVRCRPLNSTEKKQGSVNIIDVNKEKKEICIKDRPSLSLPVKKFTFDYVFGPKATQMEVYKTTVLPVIEEVLQGYNCTIFAYGQTGSGKTYTMEGEKTENCNWNDDPLAGVIPRAMCQIFSRLNAMDVEYSVRVSYLEIYNEELIDLLGAETEENPKLKIYDDASRKGSLVITGLEDLPIHNKHEVYQILERGSQRRQTAATLMNAHSSRSHSLFMVSIHMKDTSIDGEELLKVGKLNLVDLAGSECIGRSGAVDKRAREAGNINQSLLTLGRVITALVEHAPHVPYRESKLTRLLKDSLGGHTKTSVIATVTPASSFIEETLSTLEYAHRTRNITNRPEINQKLSKKTILKTYTEEIEKLRKELQAARDKSGIYLPTESYEEMVTNLRQQKDAIKDYEEEIACLSSEMQKINEMFAETKEKLEDTTKQLDDTQQNLHVTKKTLRLTKKQRDEQKHLVTEHVKTETVLHEQASQLLHTAEESTTDVSGLHAKLDRKSKVEKHNETAQEQFRRHFHCDVEKMQNSLKSYTENHTHSLAALKSDMGGLVSKSMDDIKGLSRDISDVINMVSGQATALHQSQERYNDDDSKWVENLSSFCKDSLHGEISRQNNFHKEIFLNVMASIHNILHQIGTNLNDVNEKLELQLRGQKGSIEEFMKEQIDNLNHLKEIGTEFAEQQQKETQSLIGDVQKTCRSQIEKNEMLVDEVRQSVNNLLADMLQKQNSHLKTNIDHLSENLTESCQKTEQFSGTLNSQIESMVIVTKHGCDELQRQCTQDNVTIQQAVEQFKSQKSELDKKTASLDNEMNQFSAVGNEVFTSMGDQISTMVNEHVGSTEAHFSSHQMAIKTLDTDCSSALRQIDVAQTNQNKELTETIQSQQMSVENSCKETLDWSETHIKELDSREKSLLHFFIEEMKKDIPTGTTPERRKFTFPRTLVKTEEHGVILEEFHKDYTLNEAALTPLPDTSLVSELDLDDAADDADSVQQHESSDDSSTKNSSLTSESEDLPLNTKENEMVVKKVTQENRVKHNSTISSSKERVKATSAHDGTPSNGGRAPLKAKNQKYGH